MTDTTPPAPLPRRKRNILWWLAGGFLLLILLFMLQLFGPDATILVAPETTYLTEPIGANGLPDYEQAILERQRQGVTPDNNAAVLMWRALWPGELDPKHYLPMCTELGIAEVPDEEESLVSIHSDDVRAGLIEWLREVNDIDQGQASQSEEDEFIGYGGEYGSFGYEYGAYGDPVEMAADALIDHTGNTGWTTEQLPTIAKWVDDNQQPLDWLVEASQRPQYYSPSPSSLDDSQEGLIAMLLPGAQGAREAARCLPRRAMWHLGEGRLDEAWRDMLAVHRLARLLGQGDTLIHQLVAIAMDGIATEGTEALLSDTRLQPDLARQIESELAFLPDWSAMGRCLDQMERFSFLDSTLMLARSEMGGDLGDWLGVGDEAFAALGILSLDWNIVLREGNRWYDRMSQAASQPTRTARQAAFGKIDADLVALERNLGQPGSMVGGLFSRRQRSEIAAGVMLSLFLPAVSAATEAQDRANTQLELLRQAAALAVYRAEHGSYPAKLDELVPEVSDALPIDVYNQQAFAYRLTDDGYLLYSLGPNGNDDGGSNDQREILEGRQLVQEVLGQDAYDRQFDQIPDNADDLSIRLPVPPLRIPTLADE